MSAPKIKFSYDFSRGSCAARRLKGQALNQKFFQGIMNLYKDTDKVNIRTIERQYKKMMPESIYFSIKKLLPSEAEAASVSGIMQTEFLNSRLVNYRVKIESGNKLEIKQLPILIHEITHLLDMLLNPKTISAEESVIKRNLSDIFEDLYMNHYELQYNSPEELKKHMKEIKKKTKKMLKNLNTEDKVLILNNIKNTLKTEINALKEEQKYACKLELMGRNVDKDSLMTKNETNMFELELKLIEQILYNIITNKRHQMALKHTSNPLIRIKMSIIHELKNLLNA